MNTIIYKIHNLDESFVPQIQQAAEVLKCGGLVAIPTETVYGLGANAMDEKAAAKIYAAKGRPSDNPLIVHIAKESQLQKIAKQIPGKARTLAQVFWPGPLTMIFWKQEEVPLGTTGGLETVGVRMPNHPVTLRLIEEADICIAAPSANLSGRPSPTRAEHVIEDMDGKIDMILDAGDTGIGLESTIVDMTVEPPMILRPGYITKEMLEEVIGQVRIDPAIHLKHPENIQPKAPGMKYRHYAPKAELTVMEGDIDSVVETICRFCRQEKANGKRVGILATEETKDKYLGDVVLSIGSRNNVDTIGKNLYAVLREFDRQKVDIIYSEAFIGEQYGQAIMNRLKKASGKPLFHCQRGTHTQS